MSQRRLISVRQGNDAGHVGEMRQYLGCRFDQHLRFEIRVQPVAELLDLTLVQRAYMQQTVDEEAQPAIGGNAPGRRMRRPNQAMPLELGEHVAHGGGTDFDPGLRGKATRRHRRALGNIVLHQQLEDPLGARIENVFSRSSHRDYKLTGRLR